MTTKPGLAVSERFEIGTCLGRGSMGVVYRAHDRETGSEIALKTLHRWDPEEVYLLKQEFRTLADIRHANLVELYELFAHDRSCFFTMELVSGVTVLEALRAAGADWERVTAIVTRLVQALATVHARGRLHRDIKPENVLVAADDRVVVLDFGLATLLHAVGDDAAEFVGTPVFMSPEQMWGLPLAPAADWYAVGVLLYLAFRGDPPFEGAMTAMLAAKDRGIASGWSRGTVPSHLDELVVALLDPKAAARPRADGILRMLRGHDHEPTPMSVERDDSAAASPIDGPFIGRAFELAALHEALDAAANRTVTVLLEGPSGIGKSALVHQFLAEAETGAHALALSGRCHPQEILPYQGFDALVDRLSRHLCQASPSERAALVSEPDAALLRIFPVLGRIPDWNVAEVDLPLEPQEIRRRGFVAFRELLARIGQHRRLVLWIDDAQWGGTDSAALLRELLREPEAPSLMLILSYRSLDGDPPEMVTSCGGADGHGTRAPTTITLAPLSREETRALASTLATTDALDVDAITRESEGSPFLLMQLAKFGQSEQSGGAVQVRDVVRQRVRALSSDAQSLLALVALASGPIERGILLRAAGLGEAARPLITSLQGERLLRLNQLGSRPLVEAYHDRIREGVLGELTATDCVARHRALARAFEDAGATEPDRLAGHLHGAGELERASHYAAIAGDRAMTALAFGTAARFYRQAREWWASEPTRRTELHVREARALVNAGRCAEAGARYLAAAHESAADASIDLRRCAAEQLLGGGDVDAGLEVLQPLLAELHIPYPRSGQRAILSAVGRLLQLAVRGTRFRARTDERATAELVRADVCYSAAKAFVIIDPPRGVYFSVLGLIVALNAGEAARVCRSLALVGGSVLSVSGGALGSIGRRLMAQATRLARARRDPYLVGMTATSMGPVSLVAGDWARALRNADRGVRLLRDRCQGVSFECAIGRMAAMRALEELGRLRELDGRAEEMLAAARETGDRYAEVTATTYAAFARLARDDAEGARALAQRALARWSRDGFHIQHLYALRIEVYCDLYEGRAREAWTRLEDAWPRLRASSLLRVPLPRVDAHLMRARVSLALARGDASRLRDAERDAKVIGRVGGPETIPHALLLRAAIARLGGDTDRARDLAIVAASAYRKARMALHALYAERLAAELAGARDAVVAAEDEARAHGIGNPRRWAAIYAPGIMEGGAAASV